MEIFLWKDIISTARKELFGIYSDEEITLLTEMLAASFTDNSYSTEKGFCNIPKHDIAINLKAHQKFLEALKRLKVGEPIQYVLGEQWFYGMKFKVTQDVLIPRPETEELVEFVLESLQPLSSEKLTILDVGTGSGCIAIALKKHFPNATVFGLDISVGALKIAQQNAQEIGVEVEWLLADIFTLKKIPYSVDVVVSNPPYIPEGERNTMQPQVVHFEPSLALFVPDVNPLIFYNRILEFSNDNLARNGWIFFEVHQRFGNEVLKKTTSFFKKAGLKTDISGNSRIVWGRGLKN